MDAETAQMNGNGSANGDHEDTQNGTNGIDEHVLEDAEHSEIETLKEKARHSVGDEIQLHKKYGDIDEGTAAEAPPVLDMETAQKSFDEGDEDDLRKEEIANEEVNEVPEHRESDEGPEHRESENVNEHRDYDEIPEQKVSDEITEHGKSNEYPGNETEDITEQRDSDEPVENEESPGKMMAVSCDSIDVMSTTAEDGSEVGAEEVQSPVCNDGQVEEEAKSEETSENTLNGEQSPEVEQVIEEVDHLMEEAGNGDTSPEEEKDTNFEETEVEPSSDAEIMSPEPAAVVEEQKVGEPEIDEAQSSPSEEQDVAAEETREEVQDESQLDVEVHETPDEVQADEVVPATEEHQEDKQEPVVDLDAAKETGTMEEDHRDQAAGSSHDEEAEESAEDQEINEEGTSQEEPVDVREEQQTVETDHSMDEVATEEQVSVKEEEAEEEKEQECPLEDAIEVPEVEGDVQEVKPEMESEVVEETHQEDSAPEEEAYVPEASHDIDNVEETDTAPESLQNNEEIENAEQECAESDIAIESDVPAVENQQIEKSCEIEHSEVKADNVNESQNIDSAIGATGMATSEESAQESEMEDLPESHQAGHSPTRRLSAQERFGLSTSLSSSENLHAVLQEEEDNVSSDGASSGGSPKHKRKSHKTGDIEGDMEQVENTVRKMSVGSSKEWYKDLFKMTRSEVDKNVVEVGEDNREEEIQSLPSLRNIKSRFENRDDAPQKEVKQPGKIKVEWGASDMRQKEVSPSPPRDPEIFREQKVQTQEEVLVSYGGLTSIKSRYLESTSPVAPAQGPPPPKAIPRTEEPVQKAPSVSPPREVGVIRSDEPKDETEELPPQNITKGLLARFRDMESQSGNQASAPAPYNKRNVHAKSAPAPAAPASSGDWERIDRSGQGEKSKSSEKSRKTSRSDVMKDVHSPTGMESPVGDENRNRDEVKEEFPSSPIHLLASRYGTSVRASPKSSSQPAQKKTSKVWTPPPKAEKLASPPKIPHHLKRSPIKTTPAPRTDLIEADLVRPEQPPEAGEFENQPQFRDDVIREDDDNETEHLPASGNLKSRLAVFKQMEATTGSQTSSPPPSFGNQYSSRQSPSRVNGNPGNSNTGEVLREGEANPEEELPQVGAAKSMREKFQSMQQTDDASANSGDKKATAKSKQLLNSTVQPKGHRFTPPRGSPEKQLPEVSSAEQPRLDNVTRSDDPLEEEPLPTQEILHTCLNRFRQMEEEAKIQKSREYSPGPRKSSIGNSFVTEFHEGQKSAPLKPPRHVASTGADHTVYNPAAPEGGEFENEPIVRDDVIRESDNFEVQELPQQGQARKLREQYLAKAH